MVSRGKKITFALSVRTEQVIPLPRLIEKPFIKLVTHNFSSNVTSHQVLTFVYYTPRIYLTHSFVDEKVNTMYRIFQRIRRLFNPGKSSQKSVVLYAGKYGITF
jgi:hypothetical protein